MSLNTMFLAPRDSKRAAWPPAFTMLAPSNSQSRIGGCHRMMAFCPAAVVLPMNLRRGR